MTILFEHMTPRRDEYGTSQDIEAIRFVNGDVNVIIGTWGERSDKTTKGYLLSADDAARFGRALCEVADPFDGLVERATKEQVKR
jgi:hypothetical protein